ncbi:MAG TPA: fumarylacetoacetate hydrolase family protein [Caldilineaceae bacterium]|nr:fumarylacetoacetate hydrolase family protein [Caldilineaceae bacterium]
MYLTRHRTPSGPRWAADGHLLPPGLTLAALLALPRPAMQAALSSLPQGPTADGAPLTPVEPALEVWGSGVTYLRSREARKAESTTADVYQKVYEAERPEIFFKSAGWRVVGSGEPVRIRRDTRWNVPEPELTLVINAFGEIVGYTIGNDMSSRDIEGENPLYLPQAKTYNGSCAVGPGIRLCGAEEMAGLTIQMQIERSAQVVFTGDTSTSNMKRSFQELADYLYRELDFPYGAFLMTGTGIVPPDQFTLASGDVIRISIAGKTLENQVL